jgi:hypothetical protein
MLTGGSAYTKAYAKADRESHSYARAAAEIKDACILTRATKNAPRHRKKNATAARRSVDEAELLAARAEADQDGKLASQKHGHVSWPAVPITAPRTK